MGKSDQKDLKDIGLMTKIGGDVCTPIGKTGARIYTSPDVKQIASGTKSPVSSEDLAISLGGLNGATRLTVDQIMVVLYENREQVIYDQANYIFNPEYVNGTNRQLIHVEFDDPRCNFIDIVFDYVIKEGEIRYSHCTSDRIDAIVCLDLAKSITAYTKEGKKLVLNELKTNLVAA